MSGCCAMNSWIRGSSPWSVRGLTSVISAGSAMAALCRQGGPLTGLQARDRAPINTADAIAPLILVIHLILLIPLYPHLLLKASAMWAPPLPCSVTSWTTRLWIDRYQFKCGESTPQLRADMRSHNGVPCSSIQTRSSIRAFSRVITEPDPQPSSRRVARATDQPQVGTTSNGETMLLSVAQAICCCGPTCLDS